jgi:phage-related protein
LYIDALAAAGERSTVATFDRLLDLIESEGAPLGMPHDRIINRRERLWELRFGDHRCAYAEVDGVVVLLHAWRKRTRKLDTKEEATAIRRLRSLR